MKKILALIIIASMLTCCKKETVTYTNNDPLVININSDNYKILQITDLHLTFGFDDNDVKTFSLIEELNNTHNPDLIVVTGDITMSPLVSNLFSSFVKKMDELKTPWTLVFGNHDIDFTTYTELIDRLKSDYLYFKVGPKLIDGGYGNFKINLKYEDNDFYNLYFLDSHNETENGYGYLSPHQVDWYEENLTNDTKKSLAFMHIPLRQYSLFENENKIDGDLLDKGICPQEIDTGFFDVAVTNGLTKGIFVGHDHLNDFSFINDGILLAYGRLTGYNGYGGVDYDRGGRIINISSNGTITSEIVLGGN